MISMRDLYQRASMHQRAHKHGHLKPLSKDRFVWIAGKRGLIAWEAAAQAYKWRNIKMAGWINGKRYKEWAFHPGWRRMRAANRGGVVPEAKTECADMAMDDCEHPFAEYDECGDEYYCPDCGLFWFSP